MASIKTLIDLTAAVGQLFGAPNNVPVLAGTSALNASKISNYVRYAAVAVCSDQQIRSLDCASCGNLKQTSKFVASFNSTVLEDQGYVTINQQDKRIVIVFRGSSNVMNYVSDVTIVPVSFNDIPIPGALVAAGFLSSMDSLSPKFLPILKTALSQNPAYKVAVVGHSLGGAIASLAAVRIQKALALDWKKIELYTYGQPRTGNLAFAEWYSQQSLGISRVVHYRDLVPHMITGALGVFAHHHREEWIKTEGGATAYACRIDTLEDPNCSNSVNETSYSTADHLLYFNVVLGSGGC